jgi:hypothetical protein
MGPPKRQTRRYRPEATPNAERIATRRSSVASTRRKFLRFFPKGFYDQKYIDWERGYKWTAHESWSDELSKAEMKRLIAAGSFSEIALRAVRIESRTNLLFSFEKMTLRDAIKPAAGAKRFALALYELLHGAGTLAKRFDAWCQELAALPRKQTRVLTWPLATVFGFLAQPEVHFFLKPNVTRIATREYGVEFNYVSKPNSETYLQLLHIAEQIKEDLRSMKPRDMIDIQSFLWVLGSDEYEEEE